MTTDRKVDANRKNARKSTGPRTAAGKAVVCRNALRHGLLSRLEVIPHLERQEDWTTHREAVLSNVQPVGYLEELLTERLALVLWRLGRVARYERDITASGIETAGPEDPEDSFETLKQDALDKLEVRVQEAAAMDDLAGRLWKLPAAEVVDAYAAFALLEGTAEWMNVSLYTDDHGTDGVTLPNIPEDADLETLDWTAGLLRDALVAVVQHGLTPREREEYGNPEEGAEEAAWSCASHHLEEATDTRDEFLRRREQTRRLHALPALQLLEPVSRYETTLERSLYRTLHELQRLQAVRAGAALPPPAVVDVEVHGVEG